MTRRKLLYFAIGFFIFAIIFAFVFQILKNKKGDSSGGLISSVFENIFPFKSIDQNTSEGDFLEDITVGEISSEEGISERPTLLKITEGPVSGATLFDATREKIVYQDTASGSVAVTESFVGRFIRFAEKSSGHIYEVSFEDFTKTKITGTTIPGTEEVLFDKTGGFAIFRYFDETEGEIKTFGGQIPTSSAQIGRVIGEYFDDNISTLSFSPEEARVVYAKEDGVYTNVFLSDFNGNNKRQIFSSPFSEWLLNWSNKETVILTTKPSAYYGGFVYSIDTKTSSLEKITGGATGLTFNISNVLFGFLGTTSENSMSLYSFNKETSGVTNLGIGTLPEKCKIHDSSVSYCFVPNFIPSGVYPDDWYKGKVSFNDSLWRVDLNNRVVNKVTDVSQVAGYSIDGVSPVVSLDNEDLLFINKKDLSLWLYDL